MKLHKEVLADHSFTLLKEISQNEAFKNFHLVGGTNLALRIGHRKSIDLDFFSPFEFQSNLIYQLNKSFTPISVNKNSIEVVINNTKVFFMYYAYPLTQKLRTIDGIRLVDIIDIGLMKLLATYGRVTRKDIIDLYFIHKEIITLEEVLNLFEKNYEESIVNIYSSMKAFYNSKDLEQQPMPFMFREVDWNLALKTVHEAIENYLKNILKQ